MATMAMRVLLALLLAGLAGRAPAAPAARIVSLDLCTDWLLAHYAEPARVAALSPYHARYPVDWLAPGWPSHDGSLERILQLRPDLVIAGEYNAPLLRRRLAALGVRVEVLVLPKSVADIQDYERHMLRLLDLPETRASQPPPARAEVKTGKRLLLLGANGIGTGRDTFEQGVLTRAGWRNYLTESGYVHLDLERLVADPPDAVLWSAPDSRALANRFAELPVLSRAVPPGRWFSTDYWRWQCPGPWTWELVGQLQRWLD